MVSTLAIYAMLKLTRTQIPEHILCASAVSEIRVYHEVPKAVIPTTMRLVLVYQAVTTHMVVTTLMVSLKVYILALTRTILVTMHKQPIFMSNKYVLDVP